MASRPVRALRALRARLRSQDARLAAKDAAPKGAGPQKTFNQMVEENRFVLYIKPHG
jgi:major membrane immunogen (membrane-anchored lipoprotein)